ncbi:MAG: transcription termination factor Rho, partial [Clostridia bacterium]|nr:transcription termination factor Rho [Clostridia bacterium]
MDYRSLHMKTVIDLRKLAKELHVKLPAGMSKADIVQAILDSQKNQAEASAKPLEAAPVAEAPRKRGRPRKNPLPETPVAAEAKPETVTPVAPAPAEPAAPVTGGEFSGYRIGYAPRIARPAPQNTAEQRAEVRTSYVSRIPAANKPAAPLQTAKPETVSEAPRRTAENSGEYNTINPAVLEMLATGDCADAAGVLDIHPDGYGFLRTQNYLPGNNDIYVSIAQIHRFGLRNGDYVEGKTRPQREGDRYNGMVYINRINGVTPDQNYRRVNFDSLIPVYPDERIKLEIPGEKPDLALRIIDVLAPIGKGQRGMIVSQPKAGKTTLLKKIANAITANHPEIHLIVLLIDERPEEVTDMKRSISGEVVYSTFDEAPENHTRVSEMVLDRAQRLVEGGKDVVVLLDSITRLARAYNLVIPPTGRSLSGGLDPGALHKP